jgi:adenylate kinase
VGTSPKVVFVCGISGVGKSHLLRRYAELRKDLTVISAGGLITHARAARDRDALRNLSTTDLHESQQLLVDGLRGLLPTISASLLIIDGHALIDNNEDDPYLVPLEVFDSLAPDGLVHIESPPDAIAERRRSDHSRVRPERSIEELTHHQELSAARTLQIGRRLAIPTATCQTGDETEFDAAMSRLLANGIWRT